MAKYVGKLADLTINGKSIGTTETVVFVESVLDANPFDFLCDFDRWFKYEKLRHADGFTHNQAISHILPVAGVDIKTGEPVFLGENGKWYPSNPSGPVIATGQIDFVRMSIDCEYFVQATNGGDLGSTLIGSVPELLDGEGAAASPGEIVFRGYEQC